MTTSRASRERLPGEYRRRLLLAAGVALVVHGAIYFTNRPAVFVAAQFGDEEASPVDVELVERAAEPQPSEPQPVTPEPEPVVPPEPAPPTAEPTPEPEPKPDEIAPRTPDQKPKPIERPEQTAKRVSPPPVTRAGPSTPASPRAAAAALGTRTGTETSGPKKDGATTKAIATYSPAPTYPAESKAAAERGTALILASVDATGRITSVSVKKSSGFPRLDRAALEAMRRHKLKPAMRNGQPIATTVEKPFRFNLE